jgi:hypothetical protein
MLFLEEGHHSKGMDMVGYSRDGKASTPIVLTDSTLISIRKQETALLYHPLKASAGVYVVMRDDATGKTFNYMHLDPKLGTRKRSI